MAKKKDHEAKIELLKKQLAEAEMFVEKTKRDLAVAYEDRFPEGRFTILRRKINGWRNEPPRDEFTIGWTARAGRKHVVLEKKANGPVIPRQYAYTSWRCKKTEYDDLKKLLAASNRFGLPIDLVDEFVKRYNEQTGGPKNEEVQAKPFAPIDSTKAAKAGWSEPIFGH